MNVNLALKRYYEALFTCVVSVVLLHARNNINEKTAPVSSTDQGYLIHWFSYGVGVAQLVEPRTPAQRCVRVRGSNDRVKAHIDYVSIFQV